MAFVNQNGPQGTRDAMMAAQHPPGDGPALVALDDLLGEHDARLDDHDARISALESGGNHNATELQE